VEKTDGKRITKVRITKKESPKEGEEVEEK